MLYSPHVEPQSDIPYYTGQSLHRVWEQTSPPSAKLIFSGKEKPVTHFCPIFGTMQASYTSSHGDLHLAESSDFEVLFENKLQLLIVVVVMEQEKANKAKCGRKLSSTPLQIGSVDGCRSSSPHNSMDLVTLTD